MSASNPYRGEDGRWYFYDETELASDPYETEEEAATALREYVEWLNGPKHGA